jgi:hypothetical protein
MAVYFLISTGSIFMFSVGSKQILHMTDPEVVKEISICTSLDFGKPSYQSKERGPLLGQGILAPELYMQKVKVYMLQIKRKYERKSYHIYIYKSRVPT